MPIFKGAGVAIVTPMKDNLEVNYDKLDEILEEQIAGKTDSIVICGTTGESATLSEEEHLEAIRFTIDVSITEFLLLQVLVQIVLRLQFR